MVNQKRKSTDAFADDGDDDDDDYHDNSYDKDRDDNDDDDGDGGHDNNDDDYVFLIDGICLCMYVSSYTRARPMAHDLYIHVDICV